MGDCKYLVDLNSGGGGGGQGRLGIFLNGDKSISRSYSVSPSPVRRKGEFLRVTESAPLVDPSEVVVATRDVQFAQPVVSQYGTVDFGITCGCFLCSFKLFLLSLVFV